MTPWSSLRVHQMTATDLNGSMAYASMEGWWRLLPLLLSLTASTSPPVVQKRSVRSRCQCSLPCCITGTSTSSAIWPRVTWTLAASEEPRCTSAVALTTQCIHRGSQPLSSSIFRSRSGNFLSVCVVLLHRTIVWPNRMLRWGHTSFVQAASAEGVNPWHLVDC